MLVLWFALVLSWVAPSVAQADDDSALASWQTAIGTLHEARERGEACASVLKAYGEPSHVVEGRLLYSSARGGFNAHIEEMLFLLEAGEGLETELDSTGGLGHAAASLDQLCAVAHESLPQSQGNKGVFLEIFNAVGGDVVSGILQGTAALFNAWVESNRLQQKRIAQRVEDQRWVPFEELEAAL